MGGGEFDEGSEVAVPSDEIPYVFRNYVLQAIEKYNRAQSINSVVVNSSEHV